MTTRIIIQTPTHILILMIIMIIRTRILMERVTLTDIIKLLHGRTMVIRIGDMKRRNTTEGLNIMASIINMKETMIK